MSALKISEAGTVQFPMAKHAVEIGWEPLTPEAAKEKRGRLIALLYLRDLLPEFEPEDIETVVNDVRLVPVIKRLSSLGNVSVGMCSCLEFCEL